MVASNRHTHQQQKRHGKHQRPTKQFKQVYWPYLPLLAIIVAGLLFTSYWQPRSRSGVLPYATSMSITELLSVTNSDRGNNGVAGLALNSQLNQAAQAKANDMVARNYWSHNTPDGQEPWVFINNAGYKYQKAGENLAYGFITSDDTVAGWMNSPPHKENLLDGAYTEVGFGFANSENFNDSGPETVVVAMYGEPSVLAASSTAAQAQTSQSAPTTLPSSSPAQARATPPSEANSASARAERPKATEKPVNTELATIVEPPSRSISRIQAFTRGAMPWIASTLSLIALAGFGILIIKHGLALHRVFMKSERFVLHHMVFDVTIVSLLGLVFVLTRTAGIIK
jgi:uncharacterized protein YkwD